MRVDAWNLQIPATWKAPVESILKFNVDVAFKDGCARFGFVLKNARGDLVLAGGGKLDDVSTAAHAELLAMWNSFVLVQQQNYRNVLIESDCKTIVSKLMLRI